MGTYNGTPGDDPLDGSDGPDTFFLQQGGNDTAHGLGGDDGFYFGAALTSADSVDGGDGNDSVALQGNYSAGLTFGDISHVETFVFLSGADTRFGESGANRYSYNATTTNANVAAGTTLSVIATSLLSNEALTFNGSAESDGNFRIYAGTGVDTLTGGSGSDGFFFGADGNLTAADHIDGGLGTDTLALRGNYTSAPSQPDRSIVFQNASLANVEVLALLSGHTNEFTGVIVPGGFSYDITMADGNVAAGARMDINGVRLGSDETLTFHGGGETDGSFRILSGGGNDALAGSQGNDIIFGGFGADQMTGGGGNDTFLYHAVGESTTSSSDTILDFAPGDTIDLGSIDANSLTAGVDPFTFIGSAAFGGVSGQLRAANTGGLNWLLQGDVNGDGVADLSINVVVQAGNVLTTNGSSTVIAAPPPPPPPPPSGTPIIAEVEPNNGLGTAQAIDRNLLAIAPNPDLDDQSLPSATIHGSVSPGTDVDYYTISLNAGEKLILDVDHSRGGLDTFLSLYGPNGNLIGDEDDDDRFDPASDPGSDQSGAVDGHNTDSFISLRVASTGTYTFAIGSFQSGQNPTSGTYDLQVSVGPPASLAQVRTEDVAALLSGQNWSGLALTYSFPTSAADYADYASYSPPSPEPSTFQAVGAQLQGVARTNFTSLDALTNLSFTELTSDRGNADIRYGLSSKPSTAYGYYPGGGTIGGDVWFNKTDYNRPTLGNYAYLSVLHETGHALGLKHGHDFPVAVSADHDSLEFTVMTYRSFVGGDLNGYRNETFGYPQTYMMYDIAALQQLYGADFTTNSGNTTYSWNSTTGQMSINGVGQGVPGANRVFMTIWDGGGNDTYDLSNYAGGVTVDLRPGEWTTTSQVQLANLGLGHMARGNIANSLLYNNDPRSLIENAIGGAGGDILIANQAANHLTGNGGADTFQWMSASDSSPGTADTVDDFLSGTDHLDLSAIDADSRTQANDAFHWIGSAAFGGTAGELRGEVIGGSLHIFADVNADAIADFEIVLANQIAIAPTDFIP